MDIISVSPLFFLLTAIQLLRKDMRFRNFQKTIAAIHFGNRQ